MARQLRVLTVSIHSGTTVRGRATRWPTGGNGNALLSRNPILHPRHHDDPLPCEELSGALAGVVTHVPAGLGVPEAVILSAFRGQLDDAALLASRATDYLLPLLLAAAAHGWAEFRRCERTQRARVGT